MKKLPGFINRPCGYICQIPAVHRYPKGFRLQPLAVAGRAFFLCHVFLIGLLHYIGFGFHVPPFHGGDDSFKGRGILCHAPGAFIMDGQLFLSRAIQDGLPGFLGKILHRRIQGKAVFFPHGGEILGSNAVILFCIKAHGIQGTLPKAFILIREKDVLADFHPCAQAGAFRAGTEGTVEGKHPGGKFFNGNAAVRAGVIHGAQHFPLVEQVEDHQSAGLTGCRFDGVRQPLAHFLAGAHNQPIHHKFDGVLLLFVQLRRIIQLVHCPVDPHTNEAAFPCLFQHGGMLALACPHHRRKHLQPCALRVLEHRIHHLIHRLLLDFLTADRAVGNADSRPQKPQIIVNFRHRAYR